MSLRAALLFTLMLVVFSLPAVAEERVTTFEALPRVVAAAPGYDQAPAVASSGDGYLVVWSAGHMPGSGGESGDLRAARLSADGELLDPLGFRLGSNDGEPAAYKSVVWNGEYYLVTWGNWSGRVSMRRVAPDGTLLETAPVQLTYPGSIVAPPVWDGSRFLLLTGGSYAGVTGHFLDRELRPLGEPFSAIRPIAPTGPFRVRYDGYNFIIIFGAAFENRERIFATVTSRSGERLLEWKRVADGSWPALGRIGRRSYIAWRTTEGTMVAEIDGNGDFVRRPVVLPGPAGRPVRISESASGNSFAVLIQSADYLPQYRTIVLSTQLEVLRDSRIDGNVELADVILEPSGEVASVFSTTPDAPAYGYPSVYFSRFDPGAGSGNPPTLVSRAPSWQERPAIAFDGTTFVTAWLDRKGDSYEPIATVARMDATGRALDGTGKALSAVGSHGARGRVAVAGRDGLSLVTWAGDQLYMDRRWIWGAKVASDGSMFDVGFALASEACGTQIHSAASRTHFLTVQERCDNGEIHLIATPREATASSSQMMFGISDRHGYDVACGDDECLVAVSMRLPDYDWRVNTMRVTGDGIPIEPARTAIENCIAPSIASNGSSYLLSCNSVDTQEIRAVVIRDGIASSPALLSAPGDAAYGAEPVWTGRDYAVVWQRLYNNPTSLLLRRVAVDGTPLGLPEEIVTSAIAASLLVPEHAVASAGHGDLALLWSRHPLTLDVSSARLWMMLRERIDSRSRPVRR